MNAGLAAYMLEAENIYREGTPVEAIDAGDARVDLPARPVRARRPGRARHRCRHVRHDRRRNGPLEPPPLVWKLREAKRFGVKSGAGIYDYADGKKTGVWPGLAPLVPNRGVARRHQGGDRRALRPGALQKARELCDRKIVGSEEECDLAFVFGIGFAMYLGGPIFYAKQRGWV